MGKVKERHCTKHKHEKEDGGHNMVIRYESEKDECPLCVALEGAQPSDGAFETLEALHTQAVALAESFKNSNVQLEKDIAGYKISFKAYEDEVKGFQEKIKAAEEANNILEANNKTLQEAFDKLRKEKE